MGSKKWVRKEGHRRGPETRAREDGQTRGSDKRVREEGLDGGGCTNMYIHVCTFSE